jgi:dUTP pyrophosphatase
MPSSSSTPRWKRSFEFEFEFEFDFDIDFEFEFEFDFDIEFEFDFEFEFEFDFEFGTMMETVRVLVRRLPHYPPDWELPAYATPGSAAVDLRNAGPSVTLDPGARHLIPTGLAMALPAGMEAQVRPRSGLAIRRGIGIVNAPGTIDSDYRGEIQVPLINHDRAPQVVEHGERIAQLVVARVARIEWTPRAELPASERGDGGFGSTGR